MPTAAAAVKFNDARDITAVCQVRCEPLGSGGPGVGVALTKIHLMCWRCRCFRGDPSLYEFLRGRP